MPKPFRLRQAPRSINRVLVCKCPAVTDTFDHHMMGLALAMARLGLGRTAPNPSVGAVLVEPVTGEVIARAVTAAGGRPHAETIAIGRAGARARGTTMYVTLEPCSHIGHTAPCADGVVAAGISRVICGIADPDPRVSGRGLARLRAAGIEVERGLRAAEAGYLTQGHIVRVTERRPFVQVKMALAADGSVPRGEGGSPVFVTSPEARALGHLMRSQADAILVGRGTVEADNPALTCRLPGLENRCPRRVVLAKDGLSLVGTRLAEAPGAVPLTVFTGSGAREATSAAMRSVGADVRTVLAVGETLWLPSVLEQLAADGATRLLVEGGPAIWRAFAKAGLVDEVALFVAGSQATSDSFALELAGRHLGALSLVVKDRRPIGPDILWRLAVNPS